MGTHLGPDAKSHDFHGFRPSPARFKPDFSLSAAPARNVQILSGKPLPRKVFLNIAWSGIYNYCCAFGPRQVILRSCLFFLPLRFFCCFTDFRLRFFFSFCLSSFGCLLILFLACFCQVVVRVFVCFAYLFLCLVFFSIDLFVCLLVALFLCCRCAQYSLRFRVATLCVDGLLACLVFVFLILSMLYESPGR